LFKSLLTSFLLCAAAVNCAPVEKRIAQTIADSTSAWVKACTAAGGAEKCQPISQVAFTSLLAAGGNCDQQNAADSMIDLAKQLKNNADMIRLAQIFVQQPRNAPDSLQVPYCQKAPKNAELKGLFHCQFAGSKFPAFSGDQTGNLPLGVAAVNPEGSCPAHKAGPVPDGVQLETLVTSPGVPSTSGGSASSGSNKKNNNKNSGSTAKNANSLASFTLSNGQAAQKLNAKFTTLKASSSCTAGSQACVNGGFAQCVGGKFAVTQCGGGTQCFALPLVNKAGTSLACTTKADATARIAATGAKGGITG